MTMPKKSRRTKIRAEHVTFGPCLVIERRWTPTGNEVLVAELLDKSQRTLLAAPEFWKTPVAVKTIPVVARTTPVEPDQPEIEANSVNEDVEQAA